MSTTSRVDSARHSKSSPLEMLERQPPFNLEAESGVLGSIILGCLR